MMRWAAVKCIRVFNLIAPLGLLCDWYPLINTSCKWLHQVLFGCWAVKHFCTIWGFTKTSFCLLIFCTIGTAIFRKASTPVCSSSPGCLLQVVQRDLARIARAFALSCNKPHRILFSDSQPKVFDCFSRFCLLKHRIFLLQNCKLTCIPVEIKVCVLLAGRCLTRWNCSFTFTMKLTSALRACCSHKPLC